MQLRNELRDKEMKLTDIRLEALSSAHQLDQLREAMNRMQVSTQEHGRSPRLPGKDWQVAAPRHTPRPRQNLVAALCSPSLFLFTVSPSHILLKDHLSKISEQPDPSLCETSSGSAVASCMSHSLLHLAFKAFCRILSHSTAPPHTPSQLYSPDPSHQPERASLCPLCMPGISVLWCSSTGISFCTITWTLPLRLSLMPLPLQSLSRSCVSVLTASLIFCRRLKAFGSS